MRILLILLISIISYGQEIPNNAFLAQYFDAKGTLISSRVESKIVHDFNAVIKEGVQKEGLGAKWIGDFQFNDSTYKFTIQSDRSIRVLIAGNQVLNDPRNRRDKTYTFTRKLNGINRLEIEYGLVHDIFISDSVSTIPAYNQEAYTTYGSWSKPKKGIGCECIYSGKQNDSLVFKFTNAERFEFWGEKALHHGKADLYFNNEFQREIDTYGNNAEMLHFQKSGLDKSKIYTFKLVVKGEKNPSSTGNYVVMKYFKLINSQPVDPPIEPPVNPPDTVYIVDTVYIRPYIYIKADDIEYRIE